MDRRDALKKLGMGGATVVGATMIVSSPAFASPGTPDCAAAGGIPVVSVSQTGSGGGNPATAELTFSATPGTISCPCTANPPRPNPILTVTNTVVGTTTASGATVGPISNGTYSYTLTIRAECLDQNNLQVCSSGTTTGTVTVSGNSTPSVTQPTTSTSLTNVACP